MKTLKLTAILFMATSLFAFSQSKDILSKVKEAFQKKYPNIVKVEWEKEKNNEFEAEFKIDGIEYEAIFLADGTWIETEREIKEKEIPAAVKLALDANFEDYEIEESEYSETKEGKFYKFEIEDKDDKEWEVTIDESGKNLRKVEQKEEEEDDKD